MFSEISVTGSPRQIGIHGGDRVSHPVLELFLEDVCLEGNIRFRTRGEIVVSVK
jgi:hypothetical protein